MNINPDFVLFITLIVGAIFGYALGRWDRQDTYVRGYKRGKLVGEAVAKNER
jgi:hypothetical protein